MLNEQFYDILDKELDDLIIENNTDIQNKKLNLITQQKSYVLLIWFLQFYSNKKSLYEEFITDGKDDSSCDIIFNEKDKNGVETFYIVQSKWNKKPESSPNKEPAKVNSDEVKKAIIDFESILQKNKQLGNNHLFNQKFNELHQHLIKDNGNVKFIFLSLLSNNEQIGEHILNFERKYEPNIKLEIIDIDRLKRDYIEFKYKQIKVTTPLQYQYYQAEKSKIFLAIERIPEALGKGDHLKVNRPYESYIFLIKPKTIYELFEKYGFSLFFSNVRNPLSESNYNQAIADTLKNKPDMFWYFNNGITAITSLINPFGVHSEQISVSGLQIINGAQTVYTIYTTYKNSNIGEREIMDAEARISLRIISSANKETNLEITRYTNSQNPMSERDFLANDEIQIRLQEESFKTEYWYERRRGEFRNKPEGVSIIPNYIFASIYLTCELGELIPNIESLDTFFISSNKSGFYEKVFLANKELSFKDFLANLHLFNTFFNFFNKDNPSNPFTLTPFVSLTKIILIKYLNKKYNNDLNINLYINRNFDNTDFKNLITKLRDFVIKLVFNKFFVLESEIESNLSVSNFYKDSGKFLEVKNYFEKLDITEETIDKFLNILSEGIKVKSSSDLFDENGKLKRQKDFEE